MDFTSRIFDATATNPGVLANSAYILPLSIAFVGLFILFGGAMTFASLGGSAAAGKKRRRFFVACASFTVAAIACLGVLSFTSEARYEDDAARSSAYANTVSQWLEDEHQIEAGAGTINQLLDGEPVDVEYRGETVTVTLVETEAGDIELIAPVGAGGDR